MNETSEIQIQLTLGEINQILEALGSLPYRQVYQLIGKVQQQAESQLQQFDQNELSPETEFVSK